MGQIQDHPHFAVVEYSRADDSENKCRAAVVAECQQTLSLRAGTLTAFIELDGSSGANRVSSYKTQCQRSGTGAVDPKQRAHDRLQKSAQIAGHAQLNDQR